MTLRAQLRRPSLTGATLVVAAIFVAGCNSSSSTSSASVGASASGSASGSVSAASGSVAGSASGGSSASGASTGSSASAAEGMGSDCTTTDLKVSTASNGGGGTAGSFYSYVDFTNTGSVPCALEGYPGVSLTDASGAQLGAAATRSTDTGSAKLVTLAPGATANAELRMTDDTVYPTSQCQPVTSAYLKVYPPNNTQAAQIAFKGTTCANSSIKMLAIGVATPGTLPAG